MIYAVPENGKGQSAGRSGRKPARREGQLPRRIAAGATPVPPESWLEWRPPLSREGKERKKNYLVLGTCRAKEKPTAGLQKRGARGPEIFFKKNQKSLSKQLTLNSKCGIIFKLSAER